MTAGHIILCPAGYGDEQADAAPQSQPEQQQQEQQQAQASYLQQLRREADVLNIEGKKDTCYTLYETAYRQGDVVSGARLALCCIKGAGCAKDVNRGIQLLEEAVEKGYYRAYQHLCRVYLLVEEVRDNAKALEYATLSAEHDQGSMLAYMARCLERVDPELAFRCADLSAQKGCDEGARCLASFYAKGLNCSEDLDKAAALLKEIADRDAPARRMLVRILAQQNKSEELFHTLSKYVHYTDGDGSNGGYLALQLALLYLKGDGVEKDVDKALFWSEIAAERDELAAQVVLWNIYRESGNYTRMFKWLVEAAEKGDAVSQAMLARAYFFGEGCERSEDRALIWVKCAYAHRTKELDNLLTELRVRRELGDVYADRFLSRIEELQGDFAL